MTKIWIAIVLVSFATFAGLIIWAQTQPIWAFGTLFAVLVGGNLALRTWKL